MKQAFFKGRFVPFEDANVSIMTHSFNYGTGVFEGIRGYWNQNKNQMFLFRLKDHYIRFINSCKVLRINTSFSIEELTNVTVELAKRNGYKEDIYIRPIAYKSAKKIGLGLLGVEDDVCMYLAPFGDYLDISKGIRVCTSTWRRIDDLAVPARIKTTGSYINSSLAKAEAIENGFDEGIFLTLDNHVAEGTGENIFIVRKGELITPSISDNILEGITRETIIQIAKDKLGINCRERSIDRSELYIADEIFLCGTGAQISPIIEVDHRIVGNGGVGPITKKLQTEYFSIVKGDDNKYHNWLTPVF